MLSISNGYRGFELKFSNPGSGMRGWTAKAKDLRAVQMAVNHHFGATHAKPVRGCPLCGPTAKAKAKAGAR